MSERELLELAAKAAGLPYIKPLPDYSGRLGLEVGSDNPMRCRTWNPLEDDGDALRLAVKLSLSVFTGGLGCSSVTGWIVRDAGPEVINITQHYSDGDHVSATRRAIVRAAAEIGRSMP